MAVKAEHLDLRRSDPMGIAALINPMTRTITRALLANNFEAVVFVAESQAVVRLREGNWAVVKDIALSPQERSMLRTLDANAVAAQGISFQQAAEVFRDY
jgi:hypothetical protein